MKQALTLGALLHGYADVPAAYASCAISGLALDSRRVQRGDLFFALRGGVHHGLEFLDAVKQCAAAVVWEAPWDGSIPSEPGVPLLAVPQLSAHLGAIASRFYGVPAQQLALVGITGTDGKTSCAHFIAQALSAASTRPCGILGTLGFGTYGAMQTATHTTPDALSVQRWLAQLVAQGCRHAVMEVSSHALDQGRVNALSFAVAVLTQLSRDHLDYHGSVAAYAAAKRRLFTEHHPQVAVLNLDDDFGRQLLDECRDHAIAYGFGAVPRRCERWVCAEDLQLDAQGLRLRIRSTWGAGELHAPLFGRFNASNLLASLATLLALELPLTSALAHLQQSTVVAGRMERIDVAGVNVVIDYAHTPHALQQALTALREHGQPGQRLICVFGCGGERDAGKRPLMGAVAERYADQVIITDDNPRTEHPPQIVSAILDGMRQPAAATVLHERRRAIQHALHTAQPGDLVLIAGKGAENEQIIGKQRYPFSDRAVVLDYRAAAND